MKSTGPRYRTYRGMQQTSRLPPGQHANLLTVHTHYTTEQSCAHILVTVTVALYTVPRPRWAPPIHCPAGSVQPLRLHLSMHTGRPASTRRQPLTAHIQYLGNWRLAHETIIKPEKFQIFQIPNYCARRAIIAYFARKTVNFHVRRQPLT